VRAVLIAVCLLAACTPSPEPENTLWAWERPEDLRFLKPGEARVAVLVNRIVLSEYLTEANPRLVPLQVNPGVEVTPVIRIEAHAPSLDEQQLESILSAISWTARDSRFQGLQIDFDAKQSERPFYRDLLSRLAEDYHPLSITALVSWCDDPAWLDSLPADEVVPMLFRMGPDAAKYTQRLRRNGRFPAQRCNSALGRSTDEPYPWAPQPDRLYWFNPVPWTKNSYENLPVAQ